MAQPVGLTIFLYIVYVVGIAGFAVGLAGGIIGVVQGNAYHYFGLSIASIVLSVCFPWAALVTGSILLDDLYSKGRRGTAFRTARESRLQGGRSSTEMVGVR